MEKRMVKAEGFLRLLAMVFAIIGACLVRFDEETKLVYAVLPMTATYKDLASLRVFVIIQIITGAYNFIQLLRCIIFEIYVALPAGSKNSLWVSFLFDQDLLRLSTVRYEPTLEEDENVKLILEDPSRLSAVYCEPTLDKDDDIKPVLEGKMTLKLLRDSRIDTLYKASVTVR